MQITSVSVTYRKQVSDGNYGSECAEVTLSAAINDEGEEIDTDLTVPLLLTDARRHVYAKLDESPNLNVRLALRPARPQPQPANPARVASGSENDPF